MCPSATESCCEWQDVASEHDRASCELVQGKDHGWSDAGQWGMMRISSSNHRSLPTDYFTQLLKMAIEIVSFPITKSDVSWLC